MGFLNMERTLRHNGLKATGVVSADAVQAYKPIFDEALRVSDCTLDETIHIGNTYDTYAVGLYGAWFNRGAHHPASNPTPKNFAPPSHFVQCRRDGCKVANLPEIAPSSLFSWIKSPKCKW